MAVCALLAFPSPIIGIGIEIMMAPEAVDYCRMSPMVKHDSRSLMLAEFLMIEKHHSILAKSSRCESQNCEKNRKEPGKFHQSSFCSTSHSKHHLPPKKKTRRPMLNGMMISSISANIICRIRVGL